MKPLHLQEIFHAVRTENVTMWAGAGCSIYAGYKKASELSVFLFEKLPERFQKATLNLDLQTVSQLFVNAFGREELDLIIYNEFYIRQPESLEYHKKFARIPHIRTVITTNYDPLFDIVFGGDGQLIVNDEDLASLNNKKRQVIKPHGDAAAPGTCVVTSHDYGQIDHNKNIFTYIGSNIATNTQVIVGFNLNDPDINMVFDKIWSYAGKNRKPCYLIAPELSDEQQHDLYKKGINYIDMKFEEFVDALYTDVMENIITDFKQKKVSAEVFKSTVKENGFVPNLGGSSGEYEVESFVGIEGNPIEGTMLLDLKADDEIYQEWMDHVQGKKIGRFVLPASHLNSLKFMFGDIPMINASNNTAELILEPKAQIEVLFGIRFHETNFEVRNLKALVYRSPYVTKVEVQLGGGMLELEAGTLDGISINVQVVNTPNEKFGNSYDELEYYKLIYNLYIGNVFTIFLDNGFQLTKKINQPNEKAVGNAEANIEFFENLREIERMKNIQFRNIDLIDDHMARLVRSTLKKLKGDTISYVMHDALVLQIAESHVEDLREKGFNVGDALAVFDENHTVQLYEHEIDLGYPHYEFIQIDLVNKDEIIAGETSNAIFKSLEDKYNLTYVQEKPEVTGFYF